jgi:hypothetical protein
MLDPQQVNDPYLDGGVHGYICKMARKHCYHIAGYDFEDLVSEGYLCFFHCRTRYVGRRPTKRIDGKPRRYLPKKPDAIARRHFMRLLQRAFSNRIFTLLSRQSAAKELHASDLVGDEQTVDNLWDSIMPAQDELASVGDLLASAPKEIMQLFQLLMNDALGSYRRFGKRRTSPRETTNEYYCRALGLAPGHDIIGQVNEHFLVK